MHPKVEEAALASMDNVNVDDEPGPSSRPAYKPGLSKEQRASLKAARKAERQNQHEQNKQRQQQVKQTKTVPTPVDRFEDPDAEEERTVHEVYEAIAPHFSQTRHKPWPLITSFLHSLPPNSLGLDSGAGNGKYLPVAREAGVRLIALDRSKGLLDIAQTQEQEDGDGGKGECVRGDLGFGGWRHGVFDFAISVAAIHHLSTHERRRHAVQALIRPLRLERKPPYARFMIYVWAYEQGEASRRKMGTAASTDTNTASEETCVGVEASSEKKVQDVLVPWVLKNSSSNTNSNTKEKVEEEKVYHRYYHLFLQGELRQLVQEAAVESGFKLVSSVPAPTLDNTTARDGDGDGEAKPWLRVLKEGWEMDNWWIEAEIGQ